MQDICNFQCFLNISDIAASQALLCDILDNASVSQHLNNQVGECNCSESLCIRLAVVSAVEEVSLESKELSLERFLLNDVSERQRSKMFLLTLEYSPQARRSVHFDLICQLNIRFYIPFYSYTSLHVPALDIVTLILSPKVASFSEFSKLPQVQIVCQDLCSIFIMKIIFLDMIENSKL